MKAIFANFPFPESFLFTCSWSGRALSPTPLPPSLVFSPFFFLSLSLTHFVLTQVFPLCSFFVLSVPSFSLIQLASKFGKMFFEISATSGINVHKVRLILPANQPQQLNVVGNVLSSFQLPSNCCYSFSIPPLSMSIQSLTRQDLLDLIICSFLTFSALWYIEEGGVHLV